MSTFDGDLEPWGVGHLMRQRPYPERALPEGTRVRKVRADPGGDSTPLGSIGTVLSALFVAEVAPFPLYFVAWDHSPRVPVGVSAWKVEALADGEARA